MIDPLLRQSLEALGLPVIVPEPEVLRADLAHIQCKSLADLLVSLVNEIEPMLRASNDGATVTVREVGGSGTMRFTVEAVR